MGTHLQSATRGLETESLSRNALAGRLEGRFSGYSPSGPVGPLETWELNLASELVGVDEDREGPSKEHSERHPPTDRHVRESSEGESLSRALAT